jgi:hypothetical protein
MVSQEEYTELYKKRLSMIEDDPQFTVLASMNKPMDEGSTHVTQYIVYTDFKKDGQKVKTSSIFVYTPYANIDKYGHSKADFQAQLLFELNEWEGSMHITVLETLGSESRLAFFDYQNLGLAQLALKSLMSLANKLGVKTIDGNISSFDKEKFAKIVHIYKKFDFDVAVKDEEHGIGRLHKGL